MVAAIHDRKETKLTPPKPVIMPENFLHTSSIGKGEKNKGPQPKQTKVISGAEEQKSVEGQAAPNKPPHTLGCGKKDDKIRERPLQNQLPDKSEPSSVRTGVGNASVNKKEADASQKEHENKTPDPSITESEKPRNSYRRKLSQGDNSKLKNTKVVGQGRKEEQGDISIDNTFFTRKKAQRQKFDTRKCVVIHDPYFDKFDKNKFSKWFDITTFRYETLKAAKADKSLQSKINEVHPEVIFLQYQICRTSGFAQQNGWQQSGRRPKTHD